MADVKFQCGHCHNLMAVRAAYLGRQGACPRCRRGAPAPAPAGPSGQAPTVGVPFRDEYESIFPPPESAGEDLFGDAAPLIEIPTEPAFPRLALDEPTLPLEGESA